jgi:hypothetical protein
MNETSLSDALDGKNMEHLKSMAGLINVDARGSSNAPTMPWPR